MTSACSIAGCAVGRLAVVTTAVGIREALFGDSDDALIAELEARYEPGELLMDTPDSKAAIEWLLGLLDGEGTERRWPLDQTGTPFQWRVWATLLRIPYGETRSYTEVACEIGLPNAMRAVASACAANRIAVAIPCHRVVRSDGSVTGYWWGLDRKRALLARERYIAASKRDP